jgi:hypothetical protein
VTQAPEVDGFLELVEALLPSQSGLEENHLTQSVE